MLLLGCLSAPVRPASSRAERPPTPAADDDELPAEIDTGGLGAAPIEILKPPYVIDTENIIRLVFSKSPRVTAAREELRAARFGLEEFRRNLGRFEPFVEASGDLADFPNRRGAFGTTTEAVAGIEKETFEGARLRLESGAGYSRFRFPDADPSEDRREEGGGLLVRGRIEKPFFGSRRRQNRVIAQAFQESNARKAQIDYLDAYREYADDALSYYSLTLYYGDLVGVYQGFADELQSLIDDGRVDDSDRDRIRSVQATAESNRDQYKSSEREYRTLLLSTLGIVDEEYTIASPPPYALSPFAKQAQDPTDLEQLIARARQNNPRFTVLQDAIDNARLQRDQAVSGSYDVTTFLEGTLFPVGSESFDDRLDGWIVGGGVTVRLNDHRVLRATRLKAEAEIRQFRAQVRAEEIDMRRRIINETYGLLDNHDQREHLLAAREQKQAVYDKRVQAYFTDEVNIDQVLEARSSVASTDASIASNLYNTRNRNRRLMGALGTIYDIVGLENQGSGAD